ncbi:MAG TPA: DUF4255 domain-containing protein [Acidobacteriaceae bacterium]
MSYIAINRVTQGLRMLLYSQIVRMSQGAVVTLLPPGDSLPEVSGVNLYLYRVLESPYTRNQPWPGDRTTAPSGRPPLGLQLFYLLTPLGAPPAEATVNEGDDAHTMLGIAMSTLYENPVLNAIHLPVLPASGSLNATPGFDADAVFPPDILNSYEQLKVVLLPTSLEELSKIWATINQPYRLSVAYEVSLVEILPTAPTPAPGAPVAAVNLSVSTFGPPVVETLTPPAGPLAFVNASGAIQANTLLLGGEGFSYPGRPLAVAIGGQSVAPAAAPPATATAVAVTLPVDLSAGPLAAVTATLNGKTSPALPFEVTPWLARILPQRSGSPGTQTLTLTGSGFTTAARGLRFDGASAPAAPVPFNPGSTDTAATLTLPASLANGLYTLRVVLGDTAQSVSNAQTLEILPRIDTATLAANAPGGATLTLDGARLNGTDIRILMDGQTHQLAPNTDPAQLVCNLSLPLLPGSHTLSATIDGHTSHSMDLEA